MSEPRPEVSDPASRLVIVGMVGSGTTTLGRALAERLQRPLLDSDAEIERERGIGGAEIAALEGVGSLHALERAVLLEALADPAPVVATAGAAVVTFPECRRAMGSATVIWLDAPVEALVERVVSGTDRRPIDLEAEARLAAECREALVEISDLHLDALRPPGELLDAALAHLELDR